MPYREGKKFRAVVTIGGQRHTKLFDTKKEAREWESDTRKNLKKQRTRTGMGLLQLCNLYADHCARFAYSTRAHKRDSCKRFLMHMKWLYPDQFKTHGDIPVALVTNTHALNFLDARSSLSGNAANEDMKQLCSMWNFGIRHYEMPSDKNPFLGLNPYPHKKKKPITPSREIVLKLVGVTTGMDRVFINVLRFTGARRSSALNLVWDDVNFESRIITTWHRKGRKGEWKSVTQPMNKTLHDSLKWWWANRTHKESPYVFTRRDGEPYARRDDWIRKICRKAGVDHISGYHALRRYYASRIMDSGKASLKDAQELIGHSSLRTTEIYVQNINPHHRGIMDAVDDDFETEIHGEDTHCNYEK